MDEKSALFSMTNEELWQLFPVVLSPHLEEWPGQYEKEKEQLITQIGENQIFRIEHIGSTAVEGLISKPTIDILIEVLTRTDISILIDNMEKAGYIYSPQPEKPAPHLMFMKGYTLHGFEYPVFHVHVRYPGDWNELYFRDYLKAHPEAVKLYGLLKTELQKKYQHDRDRYTDKKGEFITKITAEARLLYPGKYTPDRILL